MKNSEEKSTVRYITFFIKILERLKRNIKKIDSRMEGKYSPDLLALAATGIAALAVSAILFLPNYLGVANDGTTDELMRTAGIYYISKEPGDIYANYFNKTYTEVATGTEGPGNIWNSQLVIIKAAKFLDDVITNDRIFDIRFLGFLYFILYLPALYLVIQQVCQRVKNFSEGAFIAGAGLIIFSDVGYVTYFNSFYPEAVWFISLLYCIGAAMSFQNKRSEHKDLFSLFLLFLSGSVLISSRRQCAVIGFLLTFYMIRLISVRRSWIWGGSCLLAALAISFFSFFCILEYPTDFSKTSKLHAMTRGVLFSSSDPADSLAEFGIDPSYELLADASAYDYLPFVKAEDSSLYNGFIDQYTISDIGVYYLQHPGSLLSMLDVSIKVGMDMRRNDCSNYEKNAGFPKRAKSLFWSGWSSFKELSAPKTVGYLLLLTVAIILLFFKGYSMRPMEDRRNTIFLDILLVILGLLLLQSMEVIVNSGDAEMVQRLFLVGLSIDIMTYCVFAELLHKLRIV
ncbi:hypothetical protein RZO55_19475 [Clostridium boliviensis]|uniref:Transmembrane protein n=1 Tax=Clostridium boliviensis TaxID=318465 RepID=A0ABU4GQ84_9CLOT|nr:hypothetical protein [Clostridium boliviensis]MDW2799759.1 hypothetical protein [Clostridium boliviensis]